MTSQTIEHCCLDGPGATALKGTKVRNILFLNFTHLLIINLMCFIKVNRILAIQGRTRRRKSAETRIEARET